MIEAVVRYRLSTIWVFACTYVAVWAELTQGRLR